MAQFLVHLYSQQKDMDSFNKLPDDSRVWVYASNRLLTATEVESIKTKENKFIRQWTAHDIPVDATFYLLDNTLLIFAANEQTSDISGCGIDKSVAFVKSIGAEMHIDFLNRLQIELNINGKVGIYTKGEVQNLIHAGEITPDSITYNKMVSRKNEFDAKFKIPLTDSWFYSSLKQVSVTE